ncbi:hypothetical protein BKA60DRAFT_684898 [Fusarium oxysporum]|nr:hypothetical protein BKA60DRAFT_684898 [Fusarium oxysporum]
MASPLSEMLDYLWRPPRKEPGVKSRALNRFDPENYHYYRNWGFTIYRTYYGKDSDKHWNTLLGKQGPYKKEGRYISQLKLFKDLFRLFPREDPSLLNGLDIRGIQEVCVKEHDEAKKKTEGARFCFVLIADKAVLKGISQDQFFIKAVGYD